MVKELLNVSGVSTPGFIPDVALSQLPLSAFNYTRNFRFLTGGDAEVSSGYSNAFASRNAVNIGTSTTNSTFLYTWILSGRNSVIYYDAANQKLRFMENNVENNIVDFDISVRNQSSVQFSYSTTTPTASQFRFNNDNQIAMTFSTTAAATAWTTLALSGRRIEVFDDGINILDTTLSANATRSSATVTMSLTDAFDETVTAGIQYAIRISSATIQSSESDHRWQATDVFGVPILNNGQESPVQLVDEIVPATKIVDNWPTNASCRFITGFSAFLFAIGFQNPQGAAGFQGGRRVIGISDVITTPGTLPNWDFASTSSFAQVFDLSLLSDGELLSAYEAENTLYVFSTTDIISMRYDGEGEFTASKVPSGNGTLTSRTVAPIENGFFAIGNGQFYIFDGTSVTEIGQGKFSDSWFDAVDESRLNEIQCIYDSRTNSVWIKTPISSTSQEIWIYNISNDTLSILDDHNEVGYLTWSADGVPAANVTWNSLGSNLTWDTLRENSWNDFPITELGDFRNRILGIGGRNLFVHDFGSTYNGRPINGVLRRDYLRPLRDTHSSWSISRVIPWITGSVGDVVSIRVGGTNVPDQIPAYTPYKSYILGTTEKLDFRRNVKWGSVEIQSAVSGLRVSGYDVEYVPQNRR